MTTPSNPLRILCDADGVLIDFVGLVIDYTARHRGLYYRAEAIDQWDCFAALGIKDEWPRFAAAIGPLALCRNMLAFPDAREFLTGLERLGSVKIATTPMNTAWLTQRGEWLEEFGVPLNRQIHIHDKIDLARWCGTNGAGWDVLIDDKIENCLEFQSRGGLAYCIAAPYNTACPSDIPRGTRKECLSWLAAVAAVE